MMANIRDMEEKEGKQEQLIKSKAPLEEIAAFLVTKSRAV